MHLHQPRIPPLTDANATPDQRAALQGASLPGRAPLNIFRTLAHAPEALTNFLAWGSYILSKQNSLPAREREIVALVAQGYKNKEMAEKMFISEQTVKNHLHNIFDKLGVSDRLELALYAIHKGLHLNGER